MFNELIDFLSTKPKIERYTMRRELPFGKGEEIYDSKLDEWIKKNSLNEAHQKRVNKLKLRR